MNPDALELETLRITLTIRADEIRRANQTSVNPTGDMSLVAAYRSYQAMLRMVTVRS